MLESILLGLLRYQPMTGYELKTMIDHSTGHFWHAYHSQIYTTLRKLESEGLVSSEEVQSEGSKLKPRIYTLTPQGEESFQTWMNASMTEISQIKEPLLVRTYFSADRPREEVLAELRLQRELHLRQLEEYRGIRLDPAACPPEIRHAVPFWQATLDFGLAYEELYLGWLDQQITRIETGE